MEVIRSKDNLKVKRLTKLHDRKKAHKEGVILVEGLRLCEDAVKSGVKPTAIYLSESKASLFESLLCGIEPVLLSDDLFSKISSTVNPQGIIMEIKEPVIHDFIPIGDNKDIYCVLENLQDPGNMGTIIRLADAFNFSAVIMIGNTVDPFNEKVLRASMGSVWHIPLVSYDSEKMFAEFKSRGVKTMAMHLKGEILDSTKLDLPAAYFIGNEGNGLSDFATNNCDTKI